MSQEVKTRRGGTRVKVGSLVSLRYMGQPYRGIIREIRAKTKMFKVEFTYGPGLRRTAWKRADELGPASPNQPDAVPMEVKVLGHVPNTEVPMDTAALDSGVEDHAPQADSKGRS